MGSIIEKIVEGVALPRMVRIRQEFERPVIEDVVKALRTELSRRNIAGTIRKGARIAITGGSRGIANMTEVLRETASFIKAKGANPFIVPAMGSHGGATAEGQVAVLKSLGITEENCGCPILASMDVVLIGHTVDGCPVYLDRYAAEADGIVVVNRVKMHSAFRAENESGLMKMIAIGLGKQKGADTCHSYGFNRMAENIRKFAQVALARANILFGIGLVENGYDETCAVRAFTKLEIPAGDAELLRLSKRLMNRIPFESCDLLVIDRIGKNYSGEGMDPNVTGTFSPEYVATGGIKKQRTVILSISEESHGNGAGLGMCDVTTRRAVNMFDPETTYANVVTSTVLSAARIPPYFDNDSIAIRVGVKCCYGVNTENIRIVRIKNSLELNELYISEAMIPEAMRLPNVQIAGSPEVWPFDENGNLF